MIRLEENRTFQRRAISNKQTNKKFSESKTVKNKNHTHTHKDVIREVSFGDKKPK